MTLPWPPFCPPRLPCVFVLRRTFDPRISRVPSAQLRSLSLFSSLSFVLSLFLPRSSRRARVDPQCAPSSVSPRVVFLLVVVVLPRLRSRTAVVSSMETRIPKRADLPLALASAERYERLDALLRANKVTITRNHASFLVGLSIFFLSLFLSPHDGRRRSRNIKVL